MGGFGPPFEHPEDESAAGRTEIGDRPVLPNHGRRHNSFPVFQPGHFRARPDRAVLTIFRGSVPTAFVQTIASCESRRNSPETRVGTCRDLTAPQGPLRWSRFHHRLANDLETVPLIEAEVARVGR